MKKIIEIKRPFSLVIALMVVIFATGEVKAADFTVGYLDYKILSEEDLTVQVEQINSSFQGNHLVIPGEVEYENTLYRVISIKDKVCFSLGYETMSKDIESLEIGEGVEDIGTFPYLESMKTVSIPSTAKDISSMTFMDCFSLEDIRIAEDNPWYCSEGGMLLNRDKTVLILYPAAIGSVVLPEGLEEIKYAALANGRLGSLTLPSTMKKIGGRACVECYGLKKVICYALVPPVVGDGFLTSADGWTDLTCNAFVPAESYELYKKASWWGWSPTIGLYTLEEAAGVDNVSIIPESESYGVYTTDGRAVMKTSNKSELDGLSKGIYIINGRKVLIK